MSGNGQATTKQIYNFKVILSKVTDMKEKALTIVIGGDMGKDEEDLLKKPLGQIKQTSNMLYLDSYEELYKILSPAKLDLLHYLIKKANGVKDEKGVSEIAKDLRRKQEAISRDLHYLKAFGLVDLQKSGQKVVASTQLNNVCIESGE